MMDTKALLFFHCLVAISTTVYSFRRSYVGVLFCVLMSIALFFYIKYANTPTTPKTVFAGRIGSRLLLTGAGMYIFARITLHMYTYHTNLLFRESEQSRQSGQEIDITGIVVEKTAYNALTIDTPHGKRRTTASEMFRDVMRGDYISIIGSIQSRGLSSQTQEALFLEPFSYDAYLFSHGIVGKIAPKKRNRQSVGKQSQHSFSPSFSSRYAGLPEGILFGMTEHMDADVYQEFITSGLVYLVAASGGNIAFLGSGMAVLFALFSFATRKKISFFFTGLYTYALRSNVALIRAFFMYAIGSLATSQGRHISGMRLIGITSFCLVIYNPFLLITSWGYVLSVAGIRGILFFPAQLLSRGVLPFLLRVILLPFWVFLSLLGPLLVLTQQINLLTPLLSTVAGYVATILAYLSVFVLVFGDIVPYISYALGGCVDVLLALAHIGTKHGIYLSFPPTSRGAIGGYILRIAIRWAQVSLFTHQKQHHYQEKILS